MASIIPDMNREVSSQFIAGCNNFVRISWMKHASDKAVLMSSVTCNAFAGGCVPNLDNQKQDLGLRFACEETGNCLKCVLTIAVRSYDTVTIKSGLCLLQASERTRNPAWPFNVD